MMSPTNCILTVLVPLSDGLLTMGASYLPFAILTFYVWSVGKGNVSSGEQQPNASTAHSFGW